jgi:hypothetical protein
VRRRPYIDHFAVAAVCRANPGEWQPVGEYGSSQSANGVAWYIKAAKANRTAHRSAYEPAGAFEARWILTELGARVETRYIGLSADAAWADALASLTGGA